MRERRITAAVALALLLLVIALVAVGCGQPEHRAVRERIAIDARDDSYIYNGAGLYFYSDDHSTQKAHIAGDSGNLDIEGTGNIAGALTLQDDLTVAGTASWGCSDATIENTLTVTGTITGEDLVVTDTLDVNGDIDLDGDGFDVDITAGGSIDTDGATNLSASTGDVTVEAETGSVIVKGDEAAADAVTLDADDDGATGVTANVGATGGFNIAGGGLDVQGGDITLENDETIANSTDGVVTIGGFLALDEGAAQVVTTSSTLTPVGSFQPITSAAVSTDVTLASGSFKGQIVVFSNENASDDITLDESDSNGHWGGDITLTGGDYDVLTLLWDGANWIKVAFFEN